MQIGHLRRRAHQALFTLTLLAHVWPMPLALAAEPIKPTLDFNDMRVVVTYVSTGELVNLHAKYGAHIDRREIRQNYRHGFSILRRNRETGVTTCEIFLAEEQRPIERDDEGTLTLGHELLHCMLGDYHR